MLSWLFYDVTGGPWKIRVFTVWMKVDFKMFTILILCKWRYKCISYVIGQWPTNKQTETKTINFIKNMRNDKISSLKKNYIMK